MTPYLSKLAMAALHDETVTRIWMQASMTRMKKLPPLNKLLNKKTGQDAGMRLKAALIGISENEKGK